MTPNLPPPRSFTTSLFAQLSRLSAPPSATPSPNPLTAAPPALKTLFLTLHCLFPTDLLAALDLLDRRLVTRLLVSCPRGDEAPGPAVAGDNAVYYVRSSQPTRASRYAAAGGASYEVRLKGWNCSCPAFAVSGGAAMEENCVRGSDGEVGGVEEGAVEAESGANYGGLRVEAGAVPLCKHLLACFLAEKCGMVSGFVEERVVGGGEAAGWAAGWGD